MILDFDLCLKLWIHLLVNFIAMELVVQNSAEDIELEHEPLVVQWVDFSKPKVQTTRTN